MKTVIESTYGWIISFEQETEEFEVRKVLNHLEFRSPGESIARIKIHAGFEKKEIIRHFENVLELFDQVGGSMAGIATIVLILHTIYNNLSRDSYLKTYMNKTNNFIKKNYDRKLTKKEEEEVEDRQKEVIEETLALENMFQ